MGTVTLGDGRKLTVGEEFTRLSPDEQQAWVNEVAVKFPAASAPTDAYTGSNLGPLARGPVDDHGLARRQAMTPFEKAISPITEWPRHTREISTEGTQQLQRGLGQLYEGAFGSGLAGDTGKFAAGLGNVGFGAVGATFAPLSALYRSIIGQPLEDVTGIPREQTEFAAQLATPGIGFTRLAPGSAIPKTRITPEIPLAPEVGVAERGPLIRPVDVEQPRAAQAAADLQAYNPDVQIGSAFTGSPTQQQRGQQLSNLPYAGVPLIESAKTTIPKTLQQTRDLAAAEFGTGDTVNVGERIGANLREQAAAEKAAADAAAAEANAKATADWEAANAARTGAIDTAEQQATARAQQTAQETQQAVGPELPAQDMGAFTVNRVRQAHDSAEARKNALYEAARDIPAWISDRANALLFHTTERTLEQANLPVRNIRADSAARTMLNEVERFSEQARTRQGVAPAGQSMQEIEQLRANLNNIYKDASTDADKYASRHIIDALDDWQVHAAQNHLMPGSDPRALPAMLDARQANREWRTNFGYNKRDKGGGADSIINKIVTGAEDQHIGEGGVKNALTRGDDQSALLHRRLMEATGNDPELAQSIRSGTWHNLLHDPKTGDPLPPAKVRENIIKYTEGPGRETAARVFDQPQRDLMRAHADTVVETAARQEAAAAARKAATKAEVATAPKPIKAEPGDIQKLVEGSISGDRGEAVFKTLHGYAREGGDIAKLNRVVNQLPKELQGDLAGAFIRGLGKSPTTKEFSLDLFSNQWKDLTPAARKVMFRHADPSHIKALDDIATVSDQLRQVQSKFGNRSGTAQNSLAGLIMSAVGSTAGVSTITGHPGKAASIVASTIGAAAGGRYLANLLNKPAGASSIRKYAEAVVRAEREASPVHLAAVKATQRNLANTARAIGAAADK